MYLLCVLATESMFSACNGVCSRFLHVDRSINEIHKTGALFQWKFF
jgi:hypothetical protein